MFVTPLYAAVFALLYVMLAINVIRFRLREKVSLGDGGHSELRKAVRIHANFSEYVPLALLLMWFLESMTFDTPLVFWLGAILLLARVGHVIGMMHPKNFMLFRQIGMVMTLLVISVASIRLFLHYLPVVI